MDSGEETESEHPTPVLTSLHRRFLGTFEENGGGVVKEGMTPLFPVSCVRGSTAPWLDSDQGIPSAPPGKVSSSISSRVDIHPHHLWSHTAQPRSADISG